MIITYLNEEKGMGIRMIQKIIGVIGCGIMGKGVAQRFAQHGYKILLIDSQNDILEHAKVEIEKSIQIYGMFNREQNINPKVVLENISFSNDIAELRHTDIIVENVTEEESIKEKVYRELDGIVKEDCIILANTSCIPITKLGSYTSHPKNVIGVHFMNPVPMQNFAEVIQGYYTGEECIRLTRELLQDVGISCEVINDSPGFVSNRLSHLFMNEAAYLVYENVATPEQIDNVFKKGFGHKMGPLETADLIGIDTVLASLKILYNEYEDSKFRACPLLKRMVEANKLGRKTGIGFYEYI